MDYSALVSALDESMAKMRIKPGKHKMSGMPQRGEMFTLGVIASFEHPVSPGELSMECGVSTARIATTLNNLESKGFVVREMDRSDRRRSLVTITEEGAAAFKCHDEKRRYMLEQMLRELGEHDAKEYVRLVGRVSEIFQRIKPPEVQ